MKKSENFMHKITAFNEYPPHGNFLVEISRRVDLVVGGQYYINLLSLVYDPVQRAIGQNGKPFNMIDL